MSIFHCSLIKAHQIYKKKKSQAAKAVAYPFQSVFREAIPCLFIFPTGNLHDGQTSTFKDMYSMHSGHFLET